MADENYSTLENRPYNQYLERSEISPNNPAYLNSGENTTTESNSTGNTSTTKTNSEVLDGSINNGKVEEMPVKSDGGMADLWIPNLIRSTNWKPKKVGFYIDGTTGYAEFTNVFVSGNIQALSGQVGGWTIGPTSLYGTTTGILKTGVNVGSGQSGVIIDIAGLRGYDSVLGTTFNLPTDGSAPIFASGIINYSTFNVNTNAVIRTSATVGDGSASSHGILMNDTGFYACEDNQLLANANVRILINGSGYFSGTFEIGGAVKTIDAVGDIQTALDDIALTGGGTVYLKAGTYTLTADITIPSGCTLEGVSRDSVIIDCNTSYAVKIVGTDVYTTGTVTINNGATTLEGSGTTWTVGMVGRYVLLDGLWYEITARTDNDTITISTYVGDNLAGASYVIANPNFTSYLRKLTVTGATGSGIVIQYAQEPFLYDLVIYGNGTGIDSDYVTYLQMNSIAANDNGVNLDMNFTEGFYIDWSDFSNSTTSAGVVMTNYTRNATFFNTSVADNTGNGISVTLGSKIAFISLDVSGNGGKGIEFIANNTNNSISDSTFDGNTSDGIKLTATTDNTQIIGAGVVNSGGYGINIAASTCDNNQIIAPAFGNNTSGNINDSGTNTFVSPQNTGSDVQEFTSSGTWSKPTNGSMVLIQCWGGGGSGGRYSNGAGGGGGGAYVERTISISSLGATETVTIGDGGTGMTSNGSGNVGGNTTFSTFVTAYGGGGGSGVSNAYQGGGGGGKLGVGNTSGRGGLPSFSTAGSLGAFGGTTVDGGFNYDGGGGAGGYVSQTGMTSGLAIDGGGAGASGGFNGAGAAGNSFNGGAGGGGASGSGAATNGGTSINGGAGGNGVNAGAGGTAGAVPGGGGGATVSGTTSGAGGKGKCIVITF